MASLAARNVSNSGTRHCSAILTNSRNMPNNSGALAINRAFAIRSCSGTIAQVVATQVFPRGSEKIISGRVSFRLEVVPQGPGVCPISFCLFVFICFSAFLAVGSRRRAFGSQRAEIFNILKPSYFSRLRTGIPRLSTIHHQLTTNQPTPRRVAIRARLTQQSLCR